MKKLTKFLFLLLMGAAMFACENPEEKIEPVLTLTSESEMNFTAEGGNGVITYTLENELAGVNLAAECSADWVSDVTAGKVVAFAVAANEGEARQTKIVVSYDTQKFEVTVKQTAKEEEPEPEVATFTIEVEDMTATSFVTAITPSDPELYYVAYLAPVSDYKGRLSTDEELVAEDKTYFVDGAKDWGYTAFDYMTEYSVVFRGAQKLAWSSRKPGVDYVLYAYGIKYHEDLTDYDLVTEVAWELITPPMAERTDKNFAISAECDGAFATVNILPEEWKGYYVTQIYREGDEFYFGSTSELTEEYTTKLAQKWVNDYFLYRNSYGYSVEDILAEMASIGTSELEMELESNTSYSVVVFAIDNVDGVYQAVSNPVGYNFTTEQVQMSDMTIDIQVSNLYVRVCDLAVTPSVDGEPYLMIITPTEYLPANYTDEDIVDAMLGEFASWTFRFDRAITSHMSSLNPDTEYVVATFGYEGGVVTTPVFKHVFKSEPEGECLLSITEVAWGGPYDAADVALLDPERYGEYAGYDGVFQLVWIEVKTSEPTKDIFAYYVNRYDYDYFGEETVFYDLLIEPVPAVDVQEGYFYDPYYICAAAFDYKGNVTPMYRSEELEFYPEDKRPAQELIDKLNSSPAAKVMVVKSANSLKERVSVKARR